MSSLTKICLIVAVCVVAYVILRALFGVVDAAVFAPMADALNLPWLAKIPSFWIFIALIILLPGRWTAIPKRLEIRGEMDIFASPNEVWNTIAPRPHNPYWSAGVSHTTAVPDEPARLDFHFIGEGADDRFAVTPLQAVIDAEVEQEYFAYRYLNADAFPAMAADLDLSEYFLEAIPGGTRVTQIEHLARIRLTTIPLLLFLNPAKDALKRLKGVMEGEEDPSWMGKTARDLGDDI